LYIVQRKNLAFLIWIFLFPFFIALTFQSHRKTFWPLVTKSTAPNRMRLNWSTPEKKSVCDLCWK
jgi:hypothetical protein